MPNDCYNRLTVTGLTEGEVVRLRQDLESETFPAAFSPEPDWKTIPVNGVLPVEVDLRGHTLLRFPDGKTDERWYDWRTTNWGTKWSVYSVSINQSDNTSLDATYYTAWSPLNKDCLAKVSEAFPSALICLRFYETGCGFVGVSLARGGVAVDTSDDSEIVYNKWNQDNESRIIDLQLEHEDEEEFMDAVMELWSEEEDRCMEAFQDGMIPTLTQLLEKKEAIRKMYTYVSFTGENKVNYTEFFKKRLQERGLPD